MKDLFDYNNDGKLDATEKAAMYAVFHTTNRSRSKSPPSSSPPSCSFSCLEWLFTTGMFIVLCILCALVPFFMLWISWVDTEDFWLHSNGDTWIFWLFLIFDIVFLIIVGYKKRKQHPSLPPVIIAALIIYLVALFHPYADLQRHYQFAWEDMARIEASYEQEFTDRLSKMGFSVSSIHTERDARYGTNDYPLDTLYHRILHVTAAGPSDINFSQLWELCQDVSHSYGCRFPESGHFNTEGCYCSSFMQPDDYTLLLNGTTYEVTMHGIYDSTNCKRVYDP